MKIEGCKTKDRHLFVGSGKKRGEENLDSVRYEMSCAPYSATWSLTTYSHDFYQTPSSVIASLFLKKIDKEKSTVKFASSSTIDLDLRTSDNKRYLQNVPLYAPIDPEQSTFKIMGTKLELTLAKADGSSWPVLRADERLTGEIIQIGRAGRA